MAIEKETVIAKVEVVGEYKTIQVATDTVIKEDGKELSRTRHRKVLKPLDYLVDEHTWAITYFDTDISNEHQDVKTVADAVWTSDIKEKYKTVIEKTINEVKEHS
tara:strand:+ start:669 stop:983 length:315 start_codon:yes stop_codon:yes gene_type:complete